MSTPDSEQELERILSHVMNAANSHYTGKSPCLSPGDVEMVNSLPDFIKADRLRTAKEARIHELVLLPLDTTPDGKCFVNMTNEQRLDRIAELQENTDEA